MERDEILVEKYYGSLQANREIWGSGNGEGDCKTTRKTGENKT